MYSARLSTTVPLLLTTALGLLATDLYLPAIPTITEALETSVEHAQYTLVAFFAAFSAFQLVYGALAHYATQARTCSSFIRIRASTAAFTNRNARRKPFCPIRIKALTHGSNSIVTIPTNGRTSLGKANPRVDAEKYDGVSTKFNEHFSPNPG